MHLLVSAQYIDSIMHGATIKGIVSMCVSEFLKPSLHELLGPSLILSLIALFLVMKTFLIDGEELQKIVP